jgi:hypothetical protein
LHQQTFVNGCRGEASVCLPQNEQVVTPTGSVTLSVEAIKHLAMSMAAVLGLGVALAVIPGHATCVIVGDGIAFRVGRMMRECLTDAESGIPSAGAIARVHPADVLFVSAGSNDPSNPQLENNLKAIRAKASAAVVWIAPISSSAAEAVKHVAAAHNDSVIQFRTKDGRHPRSYSDLANRLRKYLK